MEKWTKMSNDLIRRLLRSRGTMAEYYFDIETEGLDPETSQICTVQFQKLSTLSGSPEGDLVIWKAWEKSEREMIAEFHEMFYAGPQEKEKVWQFIPIGQNLLFDFNFLNHKVRQHLGKEYLLDFLKDKPFLDIKHILIVKNYGRFHGYDQLLGNTDESAKVGDWFRNGEYDKIESYIKREAENFIAAYRVLKTAIPRIRLPAEQ